MSVASRPNEKKTLTLKRGPDGKLMLPISELSKISIRMPAGLPPGSKVVFMQDAAANTTVGVTRDDVDVTPIEDVIRLQQIPRIARKCEDDVGRAAKNLTAQRLLYDMLTEEKEREAPTPTPEFEVAAIDAYTATQVLEENVKILLRHESKVPEEALAKGYLLEETARISGVAVKWLRLQAKGLPCPKTLVSALKESAVPNWVYSRLLKPLPENQRNWFRFLFPKDPAKGIRMNTTEFMNLSSMAFGPQMFLGSKIVFDLVNRLGEEKSGKSDLEASYLLLPQFSMLDELAQVRVKFPNITCIGKRLQACLNMYYSMSRAILPLDEQSRDRILTLLFADARYEKEHIMTPLQQIVNNDGQRFRFWELNPGEFKEALISYNCPKQLYDLISEEDLGKLAPSDQKLPKGEANVSLIRPRVSPDDSTFKSFLRVLEEKGLLQRKKRDRNRVPLYTFVPQGATKQLLETVKSHKPFIPIVDDVERFLIQFRNSKLRESAAVQLHAALIGLQAGRKAQIVVSGIDNTPQRGEDDSFVEDEDDDNVPVDRD
jgi:hypothetical protein